MNEFDEIAEKLPRVQSFGEAMKLAREIWPNEGETIKDNLAEAIWKNSNCKT